MKKITHTWLVINEACEDQLEVFQELNFSIEKPR